MMRTGWVVVLAALVACGSDAGDVDGAGGGVAVGAELDAGSDASEDAAPEPDAAAPTCVAWVDACHVRACPSGVVSQRPDGTTCPADACGTGAGAGACACWDGVCSRE